MSMTIPPPAEFSTLDLALLADGLFEEQAVRAVDEYFSEVGEEAVEIRPSQIHSLRLIAQYEPEQIRNFARKQREKAEARQERDGAGNHRGDNAVIRFWSLIDRLLSPAPRGNAWSLLRACEEALPPSLRVADLPAGTRLSPQEQRVRRETNQRADQWKRNWLACCPPIFFQHFCIHFLYRLRKLPPSQNRYD